MSVQTLAMRAGLGIGGRLLDLLLPPHCPTCDRVVDQPGRFCAACFRQASLIVAPCCVRCGVGFDSQEAAGLSRSCVGCLDQPPPWRFGRAAFAYDEFSRRLVLPLKYGDRTENAAFLGAHMIRAGRTLLEDCDLLVPVPLHRRRLFSRRYNQAALLAQAVGRHAGRPVMVDALARVRQTAPLVGQSPAARRAAVASAIEARPNRLAALQGRRVVLVDDVLTTGATAAACTEALLAAGTASVDVLAAARTSRDTA